MLLTGDLGTSHWRKLPGADSQMLPPPGLYAGT